MRGPILSLVLMLVFPAAPGQEAVKQETARFDQARQVIRGADRAMRLAAFESFRQSNDANLVRTAIDAALTHDDGVLQAAALRELFRRSPGFQVELKSSQATLPAGRKFAAEHPRLTFLSHFDAERSTLGVTAVEGQLQGGPGQLSGSVLTIGPVHTRGLDPCALQVRMSGPWLMEGTWQCRTLGSLDASIDLRRSPLDTDIAQPVLPTQPFTSTGRTVAERSEQASRARQAWSQERLRAIDLERAISPARNEGRALGDLFVELLERQDAAHRRTAARVGLCHADAAVHTRAFAEFLMDLESLAVREEGSGVVVGPKRLTGNVGPPGVSEERLRALPPFTTRDHVLVRRDPDGTLAAHWNGRLGEVRVDGREARIDFPASDAQACSFRLRPDCDGASTLEAARVGAGNAVRLEGEADCGVLGKSAVEVDFREIGWRTEPIDRKAIQASIERDATTIAELLALLARPSPTERLGALEALAASANPMAIDLALEFTLTSEQTAARALALPIILARSASIVVTIDADTTPTGGAPSTAAFGIIYGVSEERAGALRQVRFLFPEWGAHLPLQVGATQILAGDDQWLLVLAIDEAGELSGTLRATDGSRERAVRALIR